MVSVSNLQSIKVLTDDSDGSCLMLLLEIGADSSIEFSIQHLSIQHGKRKDVIARGVAHPV